MVRKKQHVAKSMTAQPMESPIRSRELKQASSAHDIEITIEKEEPRRQEKKMTTLGEELDNEQEESPLPPLPTERDIKQLAISSIFTKSPKKQAIERGIQQSEPKEPKGKEKVTNSTSKKYLMKILPKKSTRAAQSSLYTEKPMFEDEGDALAKAEPTERNKRQPRRK